MKNIVIVGVTGGLAAALPKNTLTKAVRYLDLT